ncbi:MAG: hypothetical protein HEEMFOPI_01164 [Holosporales bacterium]
MSERKKIIQNAPVLMSSVALTKALGRGVGSQFICQIQYWVNKGLGKIAEGKVWIYNTAEVWAEQLGVTPKQVRNLIKKFSNMGILHVRKFNKQKWDHTCFVAIDHEKLEALVGANIFAYNEEKTSTSIEKKVPKVNTKINTKEENKSEEPLPQTTNTIAPAKRQVDEIKNIKHEEDSNLLPSQNQKIIQEMLLLWNKYFSKFPERLNKNLSKFLYAAFKNKFNSSLQEWELYLKRIESSNFLNSERFTLRLSWILKFETIDVIQKKGWGVKDIQRPIDEKTLQKRFDTHLDALDESNFFKMLRQKIAKFIGISAYLSWFTQGTFFDQKNYPHFKGQTNFITDYIETHYSYLYKNIKVVDA